MGNNQFDARWKQAQEEAASVHRQKADQANLDRRELQKQADEIGLACVYNALRHLHAQSLSHSERDGILNAIIGAICARVGAASAKSIKAKGSFMAFVPQDRANQLREKAPSPQA
jgi:hypothetical protein